MAATKYTADFHGSNHGTYGDGATTSTYPTPNSDIYGGDTPVIPRGIDNAPTVQADAIGAGSALFVASNTDYINVGNSSSLQITGNAITVTAWVNILTDTDWMKIISNSTSGSYTDGYTFFYSNELFHFSINHETTNVATIAYTDYGNWHHLTGVYNGAKIYIYLDGVLSATTDTYTANIGNTRDTYIGAGYTDEINGHMNGNICQLGLWQGALTQAEIQSVMEKTFEELTATDKSILTEVHTSANAVSIDNEADATTGWSVSYTATVVSQSSVTNNSTYAFIGTSPNSDHKIFAKNGSSNHFSLTTGKLYKIVLDVKNNGESNWNFRIGSGSSAQETVNDTISSSDTSWQTITHYIVGGSTTDAIYFRVTSSIGGGAIIYIDNFSVKEVTHDLVSYWALDEGENENTTIHYTVADSMFTFGNNLLADGDAGSDDWTNDTGGTNPAPVNEKSSEYAKEGTYSRKFVIDGSSDAIHTPTFTTESSAVYQVSFWIRPSVTSINFYAYQGDGSGTNVTASEGGSSPSWYRSFTRDEWNKITTYYTESSGGSSAYLEFESPGSTDDTHYIDEVKVRKVLTGNFGELI